MKTGLIICGALAWEVRALLEKYGWDAEVIGIDALDHVFPARIGPDVEAAILTHRARFDRLIVVYGDCGSKGVLDRVLAHHGVERIEGPHCYEMYGGQTFHQVMEEEPGTFFLTDYMVRTFDGMIIKSMGLDRFPELREEYFRNYKRVVYFTQQTDPALREKATSAAAFLGLPLEIRHTGYNLLEKRLVALLEQPPARQPHPAADKITGQPARTRLGKPRKRKKPLP